MSEMFDKSQMSETIDVPAGCVYPSISRHGYMTLIIFITSKHALGRSMWLVTDQWHHG